MENALAKYEGGGVDRYDMTSDAMSPDTVMRQVHLIQQVMKEAMKVNEHYGVIPGCGTKPTLLKPGAEKLSLTFRLAPAYEVIEREMPKNHREYRVKCTLTHIPSQAVFGEGVGACSTMEAKYRFRKAEQKCPECGKETIIKGKKEYGGGWLCYQKKGGCGAKFDDGDPVIENQNMGRIEHDNPADYYNTVLKMAKKRAHVDAVLTATAASDIFTQDIEDMEEVFNGKSETVKNVIPKKTEKPKSQPKPPTPSGDAQFLILCPENVGSKNGGTESKSWTRTYFKYQEEWYSTFDTTVGATLAEASSAGRQVKIAYKKGEKGNDIESVEFIDESPHEVPES